MCEALPPTLKAVAVFGGVGVVVELVESVCWWSWCVGALFFFTVFATLRMFSESGCSSGSHVAPSGCLSGAISPLSGSGCGTLGEPGWLHGHPKGSLCRPFGSPRGGFGSPKGSHLAPWGSLGGHRVPRHVPGRAETMKLTTVLQFSHILGSLGESGGKMSDRGMTKCWTALASRVEKLLSLEATWH